MTTEKRIAVVTSSNRGLGYAISRQLSKIGNRVILTSRNETDGLAAKQQLTTRSRQKKEPKLLSI
jgi:NAD(P)-dependent dehydrogenase (short-subunit alcohol dehydrogenase family)